VPARLVAHLARIVPGRFGRGFAPLPFVAGAGLVLGHLRVAGLLLGPFARRRPLLAHFARDRFDGAFERAGPAKAVLGHLVTAVRVVQLGPFPGAE
jgi:hypothetical protein